MVIYIQFMQWSQNAKDLEQYTRPLKKKLKDLVEIVYVAAPHKLDKMIQGTERKDPRTWFFYNGRKDTNNIEGYLEPEAKNYEGWDESAAEVMAAGPFVGVLGFSQGAVFAHMLLAAQQRNQAGSSFGFGIFVSGFPARAAPAFDAPPIAIPSLHIIGEADEIVPVGLQDELCSKFEGPQTLRHEKGHIIPQRSAECKAVRAFMETHIKSS